RLQAGDEIRIVGDRLQFDRQVPIDAVEIRAQPDVVYADQLDAVVDLVEHVGQVAFRIRMGRGPCRFKVLARALRRAGRGRGGVVALEVLDRAEVGLQIGGRLR